MEDEAKYNAAGTEEKWDEAKERGNREEEVAGSGQNGHLTSQTAFLYERHLSDWTQDSRRYRKWRK